MKSKLQMKTTKKEKRHLRGFQLGLTEMCFLSPGLKHNQVDFEVALPQLIHGKVVLR